MPRKVVTGSNAILIHERTNRESAPSPETPRAMEETAPKLPAPPPKPFKQAAKVPSAAKENVPIILNQKQNIQKLDFAIKGDPRVPFPGPEKTLPRTAPKAKFQSKLGNKVNVGAIYKRVLDTGVTIPLGDLIAVSSELGRNFADDVHIRAMPVTKIRTRNEDEEMIDAFPVALQEENMSDSESEKSGPDWTRKLEAGYGTGLRYEDQLPRAVYAASNIPGICPTDLAISPTGCFVLEIPGIGGIFAMVDTGAKMNIVTREVAHELRQHFAEDNSGKDYCLRDVSGTIRDLYAKFNDIPCTIGGFTLKQTFFESDDWKSHFQIILGQPFLHSYAADLSWKPEGRGSYMEMTIYVDGNKEGRSTTARLGKRSTRGQSAIPQMMMALNAYTQIESEDKGFPEDRESTDRSEPEPKQTPGSDVTSKEARMPPSDPSEPEGSNAATEMDSGSDRPWMGVIEAMRRRYRLPQTKDRGLPEMFNNAVNDLRRRIRPDEEQLTLEEAKYVYAQKRFKTKYEIPIGNRILTATEGVQEFKIYNQPIRAYTEGKCSFNLMTRDAQRRLGLSVNTPPTPPFEPLAEDFPITVMYAADVPINIGDGPYLPGFFLIVEDLAGTFDVMMGKPWLLGLEKRFKGHQFHNWNGHPSNSELGLDSNSIIPTMEDLEAASPQGNEVPAQESDHISSRAETDEDIAMQSEESNTTVRARKRKHSESRDPLPRGQPSRTGRLGGSFGRTL